MQQLRDKVAVITGAASGIGLAMAERAAAEGMRIAAADVEKGALEEAAQRLVDRGSEVLAIPTDVGSADAVDALARATLDHFGAAHLVFNNAGVCVTGALWECSLEDLRWSVDVNLWGVIHGIRSFVPTLIEQGEGHVVNTASMAGVTAAPFLDIYTATKHAVVALSESLYKDLQMSGAKVGASVVCPGLIQTRIMESRRNHPGATDRDPPRTDLSAGGAMMAQFLSAGTADGWPAADVAEAIIDGVRKEQFYIIPAQAQAKAGMFQRLDEVRDQKNPEIKPLPEDR